jgi:hypothetical protein
VQKALSIVRDVTVIVGVIVMCGLQFHQQRTADWQRAARMVKLTKAIGQLDAVYKKAVFEDAENKSFCFPFISPLVVQIPARHLFLSGRAGAGMTLGR